MVNADDKVPASRRWRESAAYIAAHFGKSLLWVAADTLGLYILIVAHGMAPDVAGRLFFVALAWNALCDPLVARWMDARARRGRDMALVAGIAGPAAALAFVASLLVAPLGVGGVLATMIVFRTAYALYDVPHNALIAPLVRAGADPLTLARGRTLATGLAALAVGVMAVPMLGRTAAAPMAIIGFAIGLACAAALIGLLVVPLLRDHVAGAAIDMRSVRSDRMSMALVIVATLVGVVMLGALSKALLLPASGIALSWPATRWGSPDAAIAAIAPTLLLLTLGRLAAAVPMPRWLTRDDGWTMLAATYLLLAIVTLAMLDGPVLFTIFLLGYGMGNANLIAWTLLATLARGALPFGLFTMLSKVALGGSGLMVVAFLHGGTAFDGAGFRYLTAATALSTLMSGFLVAGPAWRWRKTAQNT